MGRPIESLMSSAIYASSGSEVLHYVLPRTSLQLNYLPRLLVEPGRPSRVLILSANL
jgi:hypothetical protein